MTTHRIVTDVTGATTGRLAAREAAEQYWTTMARTADLVRKLTSLADRYDAIQDGDDIQSADRRRRVATMRTTAESGRRLIHSLTPPAPGLRERPAGSPPERTDRARSRDVQAPARDTAAKAFADRRAAGRRPLS